jgi:hypothetical protein
MIRKIGQNFLEKLVPAPGVEEDDLNRAKSKLYYQLTYSYPPNYPAGVAPKLCDA